jgi:hypothetical protein
MFQGTFYPFWCFKYLSPPPSGKKTRFFLNKTTNKNSFQQKNVPPPHNPAHHPLMSPFLQNYAFGCIFLCGCHGLTCLHHCLHFSLGSCITMESHHCTSHEGNTEIKQSFPLLPLVSPKALFSLLLVQRLKICHIFSLKFQSCQYFDLFFKKKLFCKINKNKKLVIISNHASF